MNTKQQGKLESIERYQFGFALKAMLEDNTVKNRDRIYDMFEAVQDRANAAEARVKELEALLERCAHGEYPDMVSIKL